MSLSARVTTLYQTLQKTRVYASGAASGSDGGAILEPAIAIGTIVVCFLIEAFVLVACAGAGLCCPVVPAEPEPPLAPVGLPN